MLLKNFINKSLSLILIVQCFWLFQNAAVNEHSHLLNNGTIITHSHPYVPDTNNKTPFQSHRHTAIDFFVINSITNVLSLVLVYNLLISNIVPIKTIRYLSIQDTFLCFYLKLIQQRAPPLVF